MTIKRRLKELSPLYFRDASKLFHIHRILVITILALLLIKFIESLNLSHYDSFLKKNEVN